VLSVSTGCPHNKSSPNFMSLFAKSCPKWACSVCLPKHTRYMNDLQTNTHNRNCQTIDLIGSLSLIFLHLFEAFPPPVKC
jgi:hypothetical protein